MILAAYMSIKKKKEKKEHVLYTIAIPLNLSLAELTLYLWTMSKGLVTFSNSTAHAAPEKASLVRTRSGNRSR